jgi:tetratricopeptide (TPR) repeat protein
MRMVAAIALVVLAGGVPLSCLLSLKADASQPSRASQDAPVTDCDTHAASDFDPQRVAKGVPLDNVNPALAIPACRSAVQRYPNSLRLIFQLGRAYYKSNDLGSALVQYRRAADQGYAMAQYNLGVMYERAEGVPQNHAAAVEWYRKAAEQGNEGAQHNLGGLYVLGYGFPQSRAEAVWWRKAADQGNAEPVAASEETRSTAVNDDVAENVIDPTMVWLLILAAVIAIYFLPTLVGRARNHNNSMAIFALNILLGWTFLGWVIAIVWALTADVKKTGAPGVTRS